MRISVESLDHPTILAVRSNARVTRFEAAIRGHGIAGSAYLHILKAFDSTELDKVRAVVLHRSLEVEPSVEDISDFSIIPTSQSEGDGARPPGPLGAFLFHGRIVKHLPSGNGSIFQTGDISVVLEVSLLPPDTLEVAEGTRVSFRTTSFGLWLLRA
jgi:hypothetical protein